MSSTGRRNYRSAVRAEHARQTREKMLASAKRLFEQRGWAGTTIALVAERAEVSPKTVEVVFGTKAALLRETVDYAIRGDSGRRPMPQRSQVAEMEEASDAETMLQLHAAHLRRVNARSAAIDATVEQAASTDRLVAALWRRMNHNRRFAVDWATTTLMSKPGVRADIGAADVRATFWVALDWGTYRTLTRYAGLSPAGFEDWLRRYYALQLLD